eukprot:ctg_324.g214
MSQLWRRFSRSAPAVPVCVMMPLEFPVLSDEDFHNLVEGSLPHLVGASGISGVMVDLWWGLCEIRPREYTWCGERYKTLFRMCRVLRIKCQVVLCFHMCGGNVGDSVSVSLPEWVSARAKELQETADTCILYRDRHGYCNPEYISCGADNEPLFPLPTEADGGNGSTSQPRLRTPVECYAEFVNAFADEFGEEFFGDVIHEIHVGLGPAGEIRYPSYPLAKGIWEFPGIGEFQCYDTFLSKDLEKSLEGQNFSNEELAQCLPPRETAGSYKDEPYATEFFSKLVDTRAGKHFLRWYSDKLLQHADTVLTATKHALRSYAEATLPSRPPATTTSAATVTRSTTHRQGVEEARRGTQLHLFRDERRRTTCGQVLPGGPGAHAARGGRGQRRAAGRRERVAAVRSECVQKDTAAVQARHAEAVRSAALSDALGGCVVRFYVPAPRAGFVGRGQPAQVCRVRLPFLIQVTLSGATWRRLWLSSVVFGGVFPNGSHRFGRLVRP